MTVRKISKTFINEFIEGRFSDLLAAVKDKSNGLSLEIREAAVNIYYRGGSLLKISEHGENDYRYVFDIKYCKRKSGLLSSFAVELQANINNWEIDDYVKNLKCLMCEMDGWFEEHPKKEREYQHYMSLCNDNVLDIEYAIGENGLRMDMIMFDGNELYLIENKYGNSAISSRTTSGKVKPGLRKHYSDFVAVLTNETLKNNLLSSMNEIYKVKQQLGLMEETNITFGLTSNIHIVFVLANLSLSANSQIIPNEKESILEDFKDKNDILTKYPPMVLLTERDEYGVDLHSCREFMSM